MTALNRRNFLRSSVLGASGLVVGQQAIAAGNARTGNKIITRRLGKTGIELPVISMGVMRADNPRLLELAYDKGIRHFDTAHGYQDGNNEKMVGKFCQGKHRESLMIATKLIPHAEDGRSDEKRINFSAKRYREMFETSMERLQLDYVDVLYQHVVASREAVLHEELLGVLQEIKDVGRARYIGVSTHKNQAEVIRAVTEGGAYDVVLVGINFKQDNYAEIREAIAEGAATGVGFIGMKNMAGGYLDEEKTKPVMPSAALKWVLRDPNICTCIPGFTTFAHVEEDVPVMHDLEMTQEEMKNLEDGREIMGMYCQGCNSCEGQCPRGLPVPELMRSYMYAYGYNDMQKARTELDIHAVTADPCGDCRECLVSCAKQFPVAERIRKVARLSDVPRDFIV